MNVIKIRPLEASDFAAWSALYAGYAAFYQVIQTEEMRARVWKWIFDPEHETEGLIALLNGKPVGITHFRPFARPLSATTGGFLDDLFVAPEARGTGAAEALIRGVENEGRARGWSVIRWITAEDNARARALYDKIAQHTAWQTYDIKL
ncbi:GNAT family N-acetyltransferase [Thioclava sp. A2]|uniref:GNAT family N-acetyltransferase n=1 Tax=Thioclava sp. FCG-A2 TaxID=3080562 RepID=UPI00295511BB|nr:GNAT family N-acetyltransferase [Thioclava sp. A2]MDV7272015.1 GNAT family N-acetyltransferase [Thioclava sp. A2]